MSKEKSPAQRIREESEWWKGLSGEQKAAWLVYLGRPRSLRERLIEWSMVARSWVKGRLGR